LIAIERNGESNDPNSKTDPEISRKPPTSNFRTFHVHEESMSQDENGYYFELDLSKQCFLDSSNEKICLFDENPGREGVVLRGRLYFKINDNYYNDNTGYYSVNVVSGVFKKMGFIERTVTTFETQTKLVSQGMFQLISRDVNFIGMVKALLVLYTVLFGVMFSMGLVQINQSDLVVRLLKLGIIATLISETSFDFFNTYLFTLFSELGKEVSQIIYDSTLFYSGESLNPKFVLPEDATPLSIYDVLIDMLISRALHMKILGVLFTVYCWYIPFIYVALVFIFMGIIRSVVTYVTSLVLVALLLITGPIFLAMMLFKMTQEFFDGWMKLLFAGAMMMMVVAAALAITITLFMNQVENLFSYSVCYKFIYRVITDSEDLCFSGICPLSWFDIYWWYPNDMFEVSNNLNAKNFFAFLFIGVLFNKIMTNIPQLIDTLANNNLQPFSSFSQGVNQAFMGSPVMSAVGYARAVPMYLLKDNAAVQALATKTRAGRAISERMKKVTDSKIAKVAGITSKGVQMAASSPELVDQLTHSSPLIKQQGSWGETLKHSTLGSAGQAQKSFTDAKKSSWYKD
jgi:type IV secretion system protein VirB6